MTKKMIGRLQSCLLLFLAIASLASLVHADGDSTPPTGRRRGGGKRNSIGPSSKNPGAIRGTCSIVESPTNPLPGPCVNVLLILNDPKGNEVVKDRTTPQGGFDFSAEPGKAYNIISGSKFYEVVTPKDVVHGGEKVNLVLRQK